MGIVCRTAEMWQKDIAASAKKGERTPKPLPQRPPRRRVEQHLAALPFGSGQVAASTLQEPFGSGWRFCEKQFLTHLNSVNQYVTAAFFGHGIPQRPFREENECKINCQQTIGKKMGSQVCHLT